MKMREQSNIMVQPSLFKYEELSDSSIVKRNVTREINALTKEKDKRQYQWENPRSNHLWTEGVFSHMGW